MQAAVITGPRTIEIADVPDPSPAAEEVVIEVAAAGICGTDLQIFDGAYPASLPVIPGHEFSGTVVATGRDVRGLRAGDRIAADPNIPCQRCPYCGAVCPSRPGDLRAASLTWLTVPRAGDFPLVGLADTFAGWLLDQHRRPVSELLAVGRDDRRRV